MIRTMILAFTLAAFLFTSPVATAATPRVPDPSEGRAIRQAAGRWACETGLLYCNKQTSVHVESINIVTLVSGGREIVLAGAITGDEVQGGPVLFEQLTRTRWRAISGSPWIICPAARSAAKALFGTYSPC